MLESEQLKKYREMISKYMRLIRDLGYDHPEVSELADQMDDPWYALSEEEHAIINEYVRNWPDVGDRI